MKSEHKYFEKLNPILKTLPDKPGIYQYFDESGTIIYVGKAKNLKKRVLSYFNKEDNSFSGKTAVLVRKIADIQYIITETEFDALLLENNLIKQHQPRYNVMLKDDKTYPWICIKNEPFPRIFPTRNLLKDGSQYFGPYASVRMMNTILELIRQLYQYRTCYYHLSQENIRKKKFKLCLEYHIKNCKGPCEGKQTEEDYNQTIESIIQIIKGNISSVSVQLKTKMKEYAEKMEFEKAHIVKEKLDLLEKYQSKSLVVTPELKDLDVFSIETDEQAGYVNMLRIINGSIVQAHTIELKKKLDETADELLLLAILNLRERLQSNAPEILFPFAVDWQIPDVKITVPQRGDKKKLIELSSRNVKMYRMEKQRRQDLIDPDRHSKRILNQIKTDLRMDVLPEHIECFDNSNIQGEFPVAAMVCFKNAKPDKKEYRHFNIKTVEGPNDFASMEEIIYRRYKRLLDEQKPLPQLIVIDGGKGQLHAAVTSLQKLDLFGKMKIIGIAKRLEEIYLPGDSYPLHIDKKSETLRLIQHLRDEAHRFGITHHRNKRSKGTIKTELTDIAGIGEQTAQLLLKTFKSVKKIKETSEEELASIIGKAKAKILRTYFKNQE